MSVVIRDRYVGALLGLAVGDARARAEATEARRAGDYQHARAIKPRTVTKKARQESHRGWSARRDSHIGVEAR
jgi:hypothetical protein